MIIKNYICKAVETVRSRGKNFMGKVFIFLVALKKRVFYLIFLHCKCMVLGLFYLFLDLVVIAFQNIFPWEYVVVPRDQNTMLFCSCFYVLSPLICLAICVSLGITVTCFACIAHKLLSSNNPTK